MPVLGVQGSTKGAPGVPTIGAATDLSTGTTVSVAFTAPAISKLPITGYTVTSSPGSFTASGASSPLTVTGLSSGTAYTFTVRAVSAGGTSAASSASNSITPAFPVTAYQFTSSGSWTPTSYPATYQAYILGGGAGAGNSLESSDGETYAYYGSGGGGGGGYFTTVNSTTINSGSLAVTIGAGGNMGTNGGTSSLGVSNASGGYKGNDGNSTNGGSRTPGNGGAGGSGGGGGGTYSANLNPVVFNSRIRAGVGGTGGGSGTGGAGSGGSGSGVSNAPWGGNGPSDSIGGNSTYPGFVVSGTTYGAGRGQGQGRNSEPVGSGYVLIIRNA